MEVHQLRYFVAIAECGSFRQAARRCQVSQPSLSQQIIKLEKGLGRKLFDRLGRRIALTEAGVVLLPRAKSILAEIRDAERNLSEDIGAGRGLLAVGAIPTIAPYLLPRVLQSFSAAHPEAQLSVAEDLTERLLASLLAAEIDLALMSTPVESREVEVEELMVEPLWLAVEASHPLAAGGPVPLEMLRSQPSVVLDGMHCLGEQVQSFCHGVGLDREPLCRANQLSTVQGLVGLGMGIALVPRMCAVQDTSEQRAYLPLEDASPQRNIVAVWRSGRSRSQLALHFLRLVGQECKSLAEDGQAIVGRAALLDATA